MTWRIRHGAAVVRHVPLTANRRVAMAAPMNSRTRGIKIDFVALNNPEHPYPRKTKAATSRKNVSDDLWPIERVIFRRKGERVS